MLAAFQESSEDEHRETRHDTSTPIPESDHWQE
jgi:hypothetical protein